MTRVGRPYTPEELAHIRARWGEARARVIAGELGRSVRSIRKIAYRFGLLRTARQKSAIYRQWARNPRGVYTRMEGAL